MPGKPLAPAAVLKNARSSLRLVGSTFLAIGGLIVCFMLSGPRGTSDLMFVASASVLLIAPGVLYHLAAARIKDRDIRVVVLARRTAFIQSALSLIGIAVGLSGLIDISLRHILVIPAGMSLFFVPALLVQAHEIKKALQAMNLMPDAQRGFAVEQPLAAIIIEEEE